MTLDDLIENVEQEVRERATELYETRYPEDILAEIADNMVPIYYSDLADILKEDHSVAYVDDTGLIDGVDDVWKIIQISIYEKLLAAAYEVWVDVQDETFECLKCGCEMSFGEKEDSIAIDDLIICEDCRVEMEEEGEDE